MLFQFILLLIPWFVYRKWVPEPWLTGNDGLHEEFDAGKGGTQRAQDGGEGVLTFKGVDGTVIGDTIVRGAEAIDAVHGGGNADGAESDIVLVGGMQWRGKEYLPSYIGTDTEDTTFHSDEGPFPSRGATTGESTIPWINSSSEDGIVCLWPLEYV